MAILHENNYRSTINSAIDSVTTTIEVSSDVGFPPIGPTDVCTLTIDDGIDIEIVLVTAKSGTTLTVTRGYEGTTAKAWDAGDPIENRITADTIDDKLSLSDNVDDDELFTVTSSSTVPTTRATKIYVDTEDAATLSSANTYTDNKAADQTAMEAASSTSTYVTPGNMKHHPWVAKAAAKFSVSGGVVTILHSYNISSIAITAAGQFTVTFSTPFSNAMYYTQGFARKAGGKSVNINYQEAATNTTSECYIEVTRDDGNVVDPAEADIMFYGDQ